MEFAMDQSGKCAWKRCSKIFSSRGNKRFCSPKCRNSFHNTLAAEQLNAFDGELKKVKKAESSLKKIQLRMREKGHQYVTQESLELFDIPINAQLNIGKDENTLNPILWFGKLGIEAINGKKIYYKIVDRK